MAGEKFRIKVEINKRFFCFYALLNVLGYNPEILPVNPLRRGVRIFLKHILTQSKDDLANIKKLIKQPNLSKEFWFPLRNWVICHGQPPLFKELSPYWKNFLSTQVGKEFGRELKHFWKIGQLASLWKIVKNDYLKIRKQCYFNAKIAVKKSLSYLRLGNKEINFKKFIVIPNFLDEYNRGIGPKIDGTAYAILGPSQETDVFPIQRIQHEFLHSLINPLTQKVLNDKVTKPELSLIRESLIQAIILHLNQPNQRYYRKKIKSLEKSKFKNIETTIKFLENYENQKENFKTFFTQKYKKLIKKAR